MIILRTFDFAVWRIIVNFMLYMAAVMHWGFKRYCIFMGIHIWCTDGKKYLKVKAWQINKLVTLLLLSINTFLLSLEPPIAFHQTFKLDVKASQHQLLMGRQVQYN